MLRNWKDIVVAAHLSLALAPPNSLRTWQMFTLKTELRPVSGNHQVVYWHPECFYFCPLVWWENGWVWWNMSSLPLRLMQPVGQTLETSVWTSCRRTASVWPFFSLHISVYNISLCTHRDNVYVYGVCVGLTCYYNSEVKKVHWSVEESQGQIRGILRRIGLKMLKAALPQTRRCQSLRTPWCPQRRTWSKHLLQRWS